MKTIINSAVRGFNSLTYASKGWVIFGPIVLTIIMGIITACWTGYNVEGVSFLRCLLKGLLYGGYTYVFLNILFWIPFMITMSLMDFLDKNQKLPQR